MVYIKNYCTKLVIYLFYLSQVQGESDIKSEEYVELYNVIRDSVSRISKMVQTTLMEAGVPIDQLKLAYEKFEGNQYVSNKIGVIFMYAYGLWESKFYLINLDDIYEFEDQEINKNVKHLNTDLKTLHKKSYKLLHDHFNDVKEMVANRTKPIAKHLVPIVKDIEEIIFGIFPEKTKEIKKTNPKLNKSTYYKQHF